MLERGKKRGAREKASWVQIKGETCIVYYPRKYVKKEGSKQVALSHAEAAGSIFYGVIKRRREREMKKAGKAVLGAGKWGG